MSEQSLVPLQGGDFFLRDVMEAESKRVGRQQMVDAMDRIEAEPAAEPEE